MAVLTLEGCSRFWPSTMRTGCPCDSLTTCDEPAIFFCELFLQQNKHKTVRFNSARIFKHNIYWTRKLDL